MPEAIVLGGNGLVGSAAAVRLACAGWEVTSAGRAEARFPRGLRDAGVRFIRSSRYAAADLRHLGPAPGGAAADDGAGGFRAGPAGRAEL